MIPLILFSVLVLLVFILLISILAVFSSLLAKTLNAESEKVRSDEQLKYLKAVIAQQLERPVMATLTDEQVGILIHGVYQFIQNNRSGGN